MSINRIMIDAPTGLIEIEGEKDFVEAQFDKILPLIEGCGFGQSVKPSEDDTSQASPNSKEVAPPVASDANGGKKTKRAIDRPPKGHSCADRILELRKDGFFKDQKTPAQIVEGLGKKAGRTPPIKSLPLLGKCSSGVRFNELGSVDIHAAHFSAQTRLRKPK